MNPNVIFFPCLALLVWTFLILLRMAALRFQSVRRGDVNFRYFKTYSTGETVPPKDLQASRNFTNLFEMPTLFYMVCAFSLITKSVDQVMLSLAWTYVILRMIHSLIHITVNKIMYRMTFYALSCAVLFIMAIRLGHMLS